MNLVVVLSEENRMCFLTLYIREVAVRTVSFFLITAQNLVLAPLIVSATYCSHHMGATTL